MARAHAPDTARRRAAEKRGRRGEALAVLWLRLKGFRIVGRRVKTPVGEIDLIARRGRLLVVAEVKTRAALAEAAGALTGAQRRRIARAAAWVMANRPGLAGCDLRFDLIGVAGWRPPLHLADAFRPEAD